MIPQQAIVGQSVAHCSPPTTSAARHSPPKSLVVVLSSTTLHQALHLALLCTLITKARAATMSTVDSVLKQTSGDVAREAEVSLVSTSSNRFVDNPGRTYHQGIQAQVSRRIRPSTHD